MTRAESNTVVAAFTEEQAERLTGVTRRQLRYWAADLYAPSITGHCMDLRGLRLYSFRDLVCLKVLNALRNDAKIPLQEIRRTKDRLGHLGDDLWANTTLYVLGKRVVFDNPETGAKEEVASGQGVLQIPLKVVTGQMEEAVRGMRGRRADAVGKIEQKRGVAQNQPVIAGTRIPVRSIQAFAEAGYSVSDINKQYPTLAKRDIEAAMVYKGVA
jgi:uncharacterized protein (DUF433 family)